MTPSPSDKPSTTPDPADPPASGARRAAPGPESTSTHELSAVLDASGLLALLFGEPGADVVAEAIAAGAALSAVNLAEAATVLVRRGLDAEGILATVRDQVELEPFAAQDAMAAAELHRDTTRAGLSLGDRACLALARRLGVPAVTAEQAWAKLKLDVSVEVIRTPASGARDH
jgi:PIN domain nuclease of toxin-antitoxin system